MQKQSWGEFLLYLGRIFLLLALLAFLLPKLALIWGGWMSSLDHDDRKPRGNPMRVESSPWSEFAIHIFPDE
ncbi:MAG: hypothetical protein QMC95_17010 [Desulfitobacteriaceae bacterium]|nr:hypothetical protein [Desulfitobacteriaceae bacterium]MDI6880551.1 hypothetical protein [Desulfitobacteriaceae bacterium]MDI6915888.1 hypothetical protein [Desulfitobacteriaceae bacterium]